MLNCKEVTQLVSESFDRRLSLCERFGLRMHTMMCSTCRLFRQLQQRIHDAIANCGRTSHESETASLSDDSRARIGSAVQAVISDQSTKG